MGAIFLGKVDLISLRHCLVCGFLFFELRHDVCKFPRFFIDFVNGLVIQHRHKVAVLQAKMLGSFGALGGVLVKRLGSCLSPWLKRQIFRIDIFGQCFFV
ncbi:MAG: hypothetical protein J6I45_01420, partial [Clostridia bacterium]|nr:hypothetical protein [Clostridia bacterium]